MSDERAKAVTRIEGNAVRALRAAASAHHDRHRERATADAAARSATIAAPQRSTSLAFHVDPESQRILVQVVDRETGGVVRSFPLVLPGPGAGSDEATPRGALVDAKA